YNSYSEGTVQLSDNNVGSDTRVSQSVSSFGYGGRYNKVTLKKVSKIKCFRSFSQHRNEALSP
ncbi:MAG: hypothetical protein KH178_15465, partial [Roseburia sp.]|nr:hypothetical protein [Roseburia sp.]